MPPLRSPLSPPELVSPAGDWPSLHAAVESGADAVYFGVKGMNMRHEAANFDVLEIKKVMDILRERNMKGYLTLNTIVMNSQLAKVGRILEAARKAAVDAVILWDMAVLALAKGMGLRVHLSTQASVANIQALEFFANLGARRVVLARECTLADIVKIKADLDSRQVDCELEAFIHGAMCVSISGRCFLSLEAFGKSANQGGCLQPCRREFLIREDSGESEYILGKNYVLSPRDLCAIGFIDKLILSGIRAFKIEGRMRSPEYVKVTTSVYRQAIDAFFNNRLNETLKADLRERLCAVYNRGFSDGFYFGRPQSTESSGTAHNYKKVFLGEVTRFFKKIGVAELRLRNASLVKGQRVLFIGKRTPARMATVDEMQKHHCFVEKAEKGEAVGVKLPFPVRPRDKVFLWVKKPEIPSSES